MHDFNRMKVKINHLMKTHKAQDDKIDQLQRTVDRLTADNVKVQTDMKILRDEHTEVLHAMFSYEKRNQELVRENSELRAAFGKD